MHFYDIDEVHVFIGPYEIATAGIQWKEDTVVTPYYSYNSRFPSRISEGIMLVQGVLMVEEEQPSGVFGFCAKYLRSVEPIEKDRMDDFNTFISTQYKNIEPAAYKQIYADIVALQKVTTSSRSGIPLQIQLVKKDEPISGYDFGHVTFATQTFQVDWKEFHPTVYSWVGKYVTPIVN